MMSSTETHSDVLVLVCTYNERANLPSLLDQVFAVLPSANLLVVDDGSPDGTGDWVRQRCLEDGRVQLIQRNGKLGLGTAIREGMRVAISQRYQWLVNLDGDLSHDPAAISSMIALKDQCDVAIGSRYVQGGGLQGCSWRRVFVSRCANMLAQWIVGWDIQDCSSAYRMYRIASLERIPLEQIQATGYGFLEEVLAMLIRSGARILETPIVYTERQRGNSKLSVREAISTFSALIRISRITRAGTRPDKNQAS